MRNHITASMMHPGSESLPPPKRRRIAHFQAEASSSPSGHPQFHAPSSDFNPSVPFLDPPAASNLVQSPESTPAIPSGRLVNDVLLNLQTRTHRATDESDNEDSEDALEEDAAEATESIGPGTDDFWNGEDVDTEDDVDSRRGIVSDWDLLTEDFIVEAEELGKFMHSLLYTP